MEFWPALIVLAVIAMAFKLLSRRPPRRDHAAPGFPVGPDSPAAQPKEYRYRPAAALLTRGEQAFAAALERGLHPGTRMLAKVRVADVITPANAAERGAFARISQKQLDFVIVNSADWTVLAAIELNDRSHDTPERRERDALLASNFRSAEVPLHFVRAQANYGTLELTRLLPVPATRAVSAARLESAAQRS